MLLKTCILMLAGILMGGVAIAAPAQQSAANEPLPSDFLGLADLRASLNAEILALDGEMRDLDRWLSEAQRLRTALDVKQKDRSALESLAARKPDEEQKLVDLRIQIGSLEEQISYAENKAGALKAKKGLLEEKKKRFAAVQEKIATWLSPEQQFKRWMSITFAILIGIVIVGFFVISWKDERIRQAIFSGQAGIQFLTLFSLVIAIILFGITGVLEGKELSALLGGLSGYILGRVTTKET